MIHKVYKKNRQSQPITTNDSTISSHLQMKLRPTSPFHNKSTQTLGILLVKVIFLPQNDPNLTQIGAKLKENILGRRGGECPDRRNLDLIVTNISRMIRVAQFR